jgi:hypothetical protein
VPVASVTVSPGTPSILVGTAVQLSATTRDAQGSTLSGRPITWRSSAEAVATVNATGLVTGVSAGGPVTMTATSEGQSGSAQVTVTAPVPALGFSISLSAVALSIVQGASTPTTVTITRSTYLGAVGLYVTGLPTEVTASFDPASWPAGGSTVLTLTVGVTAAPGIYNLQVNAYDPEQEGEVSTPLRLTVMAPSGYALSLTPALSVAQGSSSPLTTLYLLRTSFTGNVTLSVDSLPAGVTASFYPVNPTSGSSSDLWLSVAGNALPGTYANLLVRGVTPGLSDRTAPLTLTITVAPFILTLSSSTLSIVQGAATPTTTVNVVRNDFAGPVALYVGWWYEDHDVLPPGVTAAFAPNPATGNSAVLTLTVGTAATPGVHYLFVSAGASTGGFCCIPLTLTVTPRSP